MWEKFLKFLDWLSHLGVEGENPETARPVRIFNITYFFVILVILAYQVFYVLYDFAALAPFIALNAGFIGAYILVFVCNRTIGPSVGYWFAMAVTYAHIATGTALLGTASGIQLFYFSIAMGAVVFTRQGERVKLWIALTGSIALFIFVSFAFQEPLLPFLPPWFLQVVFAGSALAAILLGTLTPLFYRGLVAQYVDELTEANATAERLLHNILPVAIADRLKARRDETIADSLAEVTVLFVDIVGFTGRAAREDAADVVQSLNRVVLAFDELTEHHGLEKIKTIGDAYMVAGGVPELRQDHAERVVRLAVEMQESVARIAAGDWPGLRVRIGIHSGPVIAGIIGRLKFAYDIWGDTVNTAARLEENCEPGRILVSRDTRERLKDLELEGPFDFDLRGKGAIEGYYVGAVPA